MLNSGAFSQILGLKTLGTLVSDVERSSQSLSSMDTCVESSGIKEASGELRVGGKNDQSRKKTLDEERSTDKKLTAQIGVKRGFKSVSELKEEISTIHAINRQA